MVINAFTIVLDDGKNTFTPGSTIKGKVVVQKKGQEAASVINIRLFGLAETKWEEWYTQENGMLTSTVSNQRPEDLVQYIYTGIQPLLETGWLLFGNGVSYEPLPSDELRLPFSFQIPNKPLPFNCSIENEGWVTYGLEATMRCASQATEMNASIPITILSLPLDLNGIPGANIPIAERVDKKFGCCCKTDPLSIIVNLPKRGAVVGETIPVVVQIQNQSGLDILEIYAELVQVWTLLGQEQYIEYNNREFKTKSKKHVVPLTRFARGNGAISSNVKNDAWNFEVQVPSVPPTLDDSACSIIKMGYSVKVVAKVRNGECCCVNLSAEVEAPLIIGNVPANLASISQHTSAYVGSTGFH